MGVGEQSRGANLIAHQNVEKIVVFQLHVIVLLKTIWDYIAHIHTNTHTYTHWTITATNGTILSFITHQTKENNKILSSHFGAVFYVSFAAGADVMF